MFEIALDGCPHPFFPLLLTIPSNIVAHHHTCVPPPTSTPPQVMENDPPTVDTMREELDPDNDIYRRREFDDSFVDFLSCCLQKVGCCCCCFAVASSAMSHLTRSSSACNSSPLSPDLVNRSRRTVRRLPSCSSTTLSPHLRATRSFSGAERVQPRQTLFF